MKFQSFLISLWILISLIFPSALNASGTGGSGSSTVLPNCSNTGYILQWNGSTYVCVSPGSIGGAPAIGGTITGGTAHSVLFVNPNNTIAQDNANFNYNPSTFTLTLGTGEVSPFNTGTLAGNIAISVSIVDTSGVGSIDTNNRILESDTNGDTVDYRNGFLDSAGVPVVGWIFGSGAPILLNPNGSVSFANGKFTVGTDGSGSAANGDITWDASGDFNTVSLNSGGGNFQVNSGGVVYASEGIIVEGGTQTDTLVVGTTITGGVGSTYFIGYNGAVSFDDGLFTSNGGGVVTVEELVSGLVAGTTFTTLNGDFQVDNSGNITLPNGGTLDIAGGVINSNGSPSISLSNRYLLTSSNSIVVDYSGAQNNSASLSFDTGDNAYFEATAFGTFQSQNGQNGLSNSGINVASGTADFNGFDIDIDGNAQTAGSVSASGFYINNPNTPTIALTSSGGASFASGATTIDNSGNLIQSSTSTFGDDVTFNTLIQAGSGATVFNQDGSFGFSNGHFFGDASGNVTIDGGLNLSYSAIGASQILATDSSKNVVSISSGTSGQVLLNTGSGLAAASFSGVFNYQRVASPTTGGSTTINASVAGLILNNTGVLTTYTVTMPASPVDGQTVFISSDNTITTLTVNANTSQSITGGGTISGFLGGKRWIYVSTDTNWYPN